MGRAIVVGCGRVGAGLSETLSAAGHDVTVLDVKSDAFRRLSPEFPGAAVRGDGTDEDILRRAGAEGADYFFALTEGDNRNILAAQLATETFGIGTVVAKINDPVRAAAYSSLGLATICRTTLLIDALVRYIGLPADPVASGVIAPVGSHHPTGDGRHAPIGPARAVEDGGNGSAGPDVATSDLHREA